MTRNFSSDGSPFSVTKLRTLDNAHASEGIVSGCDATVGSGSFEVDIASGVANVQGARVDVSSTTVTLTSSASEDRIDLIAVDSSGTVWGTIGSPAGTSGEPNAPDIPAGRSLIALIYVRGGSSGLQSGDILNEYRVIKEEIEDYTTSGSTDEFPVAQSDGSISMGVVDVEGLSTSGASGSVPVSQGSGSLAMDGGPGSGINADQLDGNDSSDFASDGTETASTEDSGAWTTVFSGNAGNTHTETVTDHAEAVRITYDEANTGTSGSGEFTVNFSAIGSVTENFTEDGAGDAGEMQSVGFGRRHVDTIDVDLAFVNDDLTEIEVWTGMVDGHTHTQQA